MELRERFRGSLLGLAAGDAVGTTLEFKRPGSFVPITGMCGGGPFGLAPGQWTDDTSMALCLATSLVERGDFDAGDQMRRYVRWWRDGYLSSTGDCFDIGNTVRTALQRFERTGDPFAGSTDASSAGNGSLMRLCPVPMWYFPDRMATMDRASDSSRTTHGTAECLDACRVLAAVLHAAFHGADKATVLLAGADLDCVPKIAAIARSDFRNKPATSIRGTGYVVDCLEAALWCAWHTDSFDAAVLAAANLGDDADTTAAVCGQIVGAIYGADAIPAAWRERLAMRETITELADRIFDRQREALREVTPGKDGSASEKPDPADGSTEANEQV